MVPILQSRQNARVRELRSALAARRTGSLIAIEGMHLLTEALAASQSHGNVAVETVYLREDREELAAKLPQHIEVLLLSRDAFDSAAATEHSQGVAALFRHSPPAYEPAPGDLLLVAAGVQDPGNLGTLVRSAEAFGAAAIAFTPGTVDPWNGKVLRASAGSVFRMPLLQWNEAFHAALRTAKIRLLAAVPSGTNTLQATKAPLRGGCAILIGNEGNGVPRDLLALCDAKMTIPMAGPTESLNAAVAGSVLLYEASRQRR